MTALLVAQMLQSLSVCLSVCLFVRPLQFFFVARSPPFVASINPFGAKDDIITISGTQQILPVRPTVFDRYY